MNHTPSAQSTTTGGTAAMLVVTRTATGDGVALSAAGEVDCASTPVLVAHLDQAIADANDLILVDLGDVTFMDCSGVRALLAAGHSAPTRLRLGRLHPAVRRILELTAVLDVFALADTLTSRRALPRAARARGPTLRSSKSRAPDAARASAPRLTGNASDPVHPLLFVPQEPEENRRMRATGDGFSSQPVPITPNKIGLSPP